MESSAIFSSRCSRPGVADCSAPQARITAYRRTRKPGRNFIMPRSWSSWDYLDGATRLCVDEFIEFQNIFWISGYASLRTVRRFQTLSKWVTATVTPKQITVKSVCSGYTSDDYTIRFARAFG